MITTQPRFVLQYFDRSIIRTNWKKINYTPLQTAGVMVMREARQSIKRRVTLRGKPSPAGSPPYSRRAGSVPPFKQIYSLPYFMGTSVIVGMVGYGGQGEAVPGLHEHGGKAYRLVFSRGPQRRLKSGRFGARTRIYRREWVTYPIRDFMWPALRRTRRKLPHLWLNSVSRT